MNEPEPGQMIDRHGPAEQAVADYFNTKMESLSSNTNEKQIYGQLKAFFGK